MACAEAGAHLAELAHAPPDPLLSEQLFRCVRGPTVEHPETPLEAAQRIAGHADSRTTKLYDRRGQKVLLEDMERIRY